MKNLSKYYVIFLVLVVLWGVIQVPFSLTGLSECRSRGFVEIIQDYSSGLWKSPIIAPFFILVPITMGISCSLLSGDSTALASVVSIVAPVLLGGLSGIIALVVFSSAVKMLKK